MTLDKDLFTGALTLSGELDIDTANSLREALWECLLRQSDVAVDLNSVTAIDTAALQVLLAGRREAASLGKSFRFVAVSSSVAETVSALGFSIDASEIRGETLEHEL